MTDPFGKTEFSTRNGINAVFFLPFRLAMDATISDSDFRTYVLLCQLAFQEHPEASVPYTECSLAEIAALYPAQRRPSPETIRGRIYRLGLAGLVRRERVGRTTWRTVPLLEDPAMTAQPGRAVRDEHGPGRALDERPHSLGATTSHGAPQGRGQSRDVEPVDASSQRVQATARQESAKSPRAQEPKVDVGARPARVYEADSDLAAPVPREQKPPGVPERVSSTRPRAVETSPLRTRGSDLTDPDLGTSYSRKYSHQISQGEGAFMACEAANGPSLSRRQALATALANLSPEGMNPEGIEECLREPELTAAWYTYVKEEGSHILKPAAYIRYGVRSGRFPPQSQQQTPPNDSRYTRYPLDCGETREVHPEVTAQMEQLLRNRALRQAF